MSTWGALDLEDNGQLLGFENSKLYLYDEIDRPDNKKVLAQPLVAHWRGMKITVGSEYWTDGTSIPRAAWPAVGHPWDRHLPAAIVHDILYETRYLPRADADRCFFDLLSVLPLPARRRWSLYSAVRAFGWAAYRATPADVAELVKERYLEVEHGYT